MSKTFHTDQTKPGTQCQPCLPARVTAQADGPMKNTPLVMTNEMVELVRREAQEFLASLPVGRIQCVTVKKAAELLDVYEDTIRVYIRNGKLTGSRLGKDYRIRIDDIEKFLNQRQVIKLMKLRRKHKIAS